MYLIYGERQNRLYDPILGQFKNLNGEVLDLLTLQTASAYVHAASETKDATSEYLKNHTQTINSLHYEEHHKPDPSKITLLDIMLGMKCNYRCKYCLQNDIRSDVEWNEDEFLKVIRESGINLKQINSIRIWGGEPFVYWCRFNELVAVLRQKLGYQGKIWTVSNGSLFNQEKCSFCLENRVAVMFSHDGLAQTQLRNERDFLDDLNIREAVIRQLKAGKQYSNYRENFSITGGILMVLGPYNTDIKASIDYLEGKLFKQFPSKIATVFKADSRSKDVLAQYGETGLQTLKANLLEGLRLTPGGNYYSYFYNLRRLRDTVIRHLIYGMPFASFKGRCPSYLSSERLAFDTAGRIMVCYADSPLSAHNHGNIKRLADCKWDLKSLHDRPLCKNCVYVSACMGGCPMLDEEDHKIRCQSMMPMMQALFESAYEVLFQDRIVEIKKL